MHPFLKKIEEHLNLFVVVCVAVGFLAGILVAVGLFLQRPASKVWGFLYDLKLIIGIAVGGICLLGFLIVLVHDLKEKKNQPEIEAAIKDKEILISRIKERSRMESAIISEISTDGGPQGILRGARDQRNALETKLSAEEKELQKLKRKRGWLFN